MNYIKMSPLTGMVGYGGGGTGLTFKSGGGPKWYGDRALWGGGNSDGVGKQNFINYVAVPSPSNASDFGDLQSSKKWVTGAAGGGVGLFFGGDTGSRTDEIDQVTISTPANATDFGNLTNATEQGIAVSDATIGVFGNGTTNNGATNSMHKVTFATASNTTTWGGNTTEEGHSQGAGCSDSIWGLFAGGSGVQNGEIHYFTFATEANANDFGNLQRRKAEIGGSSDDTIGLFFGGNRNGLFDEIDKVTIQTTANASDFGNLTQATCQGAAAGNKDRALHGHGSIVGGDQTEVISYVTYTSPGNATDFGDLTDGAHAMPGAFAGD